MSSSIKNDEASSSLDVVITRLAMACESGDKELEVFRDALETAIEHLKDDANAMAEVAKSVRDCLEDSDLSESAQDLHDLNVYCKAS